MNKTNLHVVTSLIMLRLLTCFDLSGIFNKIQQHIEDRLDLCLSCGSVLLSALLVKETSPEECIGRADGPASGIDAVCIFLAKLHVLGERRLPGLLKRCRQSLPQFRIPCALVW